MSRKEDIGLPHFYPSYRQTLRAEIGRLIPRVQPNRNTRGLPFILGRVVDATGNCLFDAVLAQLEDQAMRNTVAPRFRDLTDPQGCIFNLSLMTMFDFVPLI